MAEENPISLYPVPVSNELNITVSQPLIADFTIINMLGSIMYSTEINNTTDPVLSINVAQWPAGTYLVRIDDGIHAFEVKKFVKE